MVELYWYRETEVRGDKTCLNANFFQYKFHADWREIEPAVYSETPAKTKNTDNATSSLSKQVVYVGYRGSGKISDT